MTFRSIFIISLLLLVSQHVFAQTEDREEKKEERTAKTKARSDNAAFHKQIMALKEYKAELKKLPALSKSGGHPAKIVIDIDSVSADDAMTENAVVNGYIREDSGDISVTAYEIKFDRITKKITSVKNDLDGVEVETEDDK